MRNPFKRLTNWGKVVPSAGSPTQATPFALWLQNRDVPETLGLTPEQQLAVDVVYACTRVIARSIGRSPLHIYSMTGDRKTEVRNSKIGYLLDVRPNPNVPSAMWREAMIVQAVMHGNAYAEIVYDSVGRISELNVLPSIFVLPQLATGGETIESFPPRAAQPRELLYKVSLNGIHYLGQEQVFHIAALATVDGIMGDSIVSRAAKSIAAAYAAERFGLNYFANNATVGGLLNVSRVLTPAEEATWRESLQKNSGGVDNAFKIMLAHGGAVFTPFNVNAESSQMVQARAAMVESILRYFGVPPHKVGVIASAQGYGRNLNELGLMFVQDALRPWTHAIEREANFKLLPGNQFCEFDLSEFTQGDEKTRAEAAKMWIESGVKSVNEIRSVERLNHIGPEGDLHLISTSLTVLDEGNLTTPEPTDVSTAPSDAPDENGGEGPGAGGQRPSDATAGASETKTNE